MSIAYLKYPENIPKTISFNISVFDKNGDAMGTSSKEIAIDDNLMISSPNTFEEFKNAFNIIGLNTMNEVLSQVQSKIKGKSFDKS